MTIDISRFREAAQAGGFIRLGEDDSRLVSYGKGKWGRFVTWVKTKLGIGSFADQNRQVMKSFYTALKSQYGEDFVKRHAEKLVENGKPLHARTVSKLIEEGDRAWKDISGGKMFRVLLRDELSKLRLELPTELEHRVLSRKIANLISKTNSRSEALDIAEKEIRKRCEQLKELMDHIDGMDIKIQEKEILKRLVTKSEDLKYPEQIDFLWTTRKEAVELVDYLKSNDEPETAPFLQKLKRLYDSADTQLQALLKLAQNKGKELGADELMAFYDQVLTLGLDLSNLSSDDAGTIYRNLTSEKMAETRDALNFIWNEWDDPATQALAHRMSDFQNLLLLEAGRRIGKPENEIGKDVKGPGRVNSLRDIPMDLSRAFNDMGIVLRPGVSWLSDIRSHVKDIAMGRDATRWIDSEQIDREAIKQQVLEDLQKDLSDKGKDKGIFGLHETFIADFFRAGGGYVVDGAPHGEGGHNLPQSEKEAKLNSFIGALGGKDVAKLVARVVHQGTWASLMNTLLEDKGLGEALRNIESFPGIQESPLGPNGAPLSARFLIDVSDLEKGEIHIHCELSKQKVTSGSEPPQEVGVNYSLAFTIEGVKTETPTIRLDDWDVLFSSLRYQ